MHGLALLVPPEFSHPEKAAKPHQYARARANATKHAREALKTTKGNQRQARARMLELAALLDEQADDLKRMR